MSTRISNFNTGRGAKVTNHKNKLGQEVWKENWPSFDVKQAGEAHIEICSKTVLQRLQRALRDPLPIGVSIRWPNWPNVS